MSLGYFSLDNTAMAFQIFSSNSGGPTIVSAKKKKKLQNWTWISSGGGGWFVTKFSSSFFNSLKCQKILPKFVCIKSFGPIF
jgi:hypothetical protein